MKQTFHWLSVASLVALILLTLAWELWLAPLRPGGSLLALKAVVLLLPLFGILRERVYTYQWSSMFILMFFAEGVTRAWGDKGPDLVQRIGQGQHKSHHHGDFHRHKKRRGDVGGDHVRASRQHLHQRLGQQVVNVARPVKQAQKHQPQANQRAHQAGAQLDQVGKQGLRIGHVGLLEEERGAAASAAATALGGLASAAGKAAWAALGAVSDGAAALDALLLAGASGSTTV